MELIGLMNTCFLKTAAGTVQLFSGAADIIIFCVPVALGLFVVVSTDTLSMVKCAGCHRFGVLYWKTDNKTTASTTQPF